MGFIFEFEVGFDIEFELIELLELELIIEGFLIEELLVIELLKNEERGVLLVEEDSLSLLNNWILVLNLVRVALKINRSSA